MGRLEGYESRAPGSWPELRAVIQEARAGYKFDPAGTTPAVGLIADWVNIHRRFKLSAEAIW